MPTQSPFVVSADWLEEHLHDPGLSIIDGSWYLPAQNRDARAEYDAGHIEGAIFFDHDVVVDSQSDLPHTIPQPLEFERHASAMGLTIHDKIVVYDGPGMFTAPRVWWMFRVMGAQDVFVLDGGFDNWKKQNRPVTDAPTKIAASAFIPKFDQSQVVPLVAMMGIVESGKGQIADARSADRFTGEQPEPRDGVRSGHMPGAINVPFNALSENGYLKNVEELQIALTEFGVDTSKPVVTTCGSGVTAAVINLALASIGRVDSRLYDGSWSEWGSLPNTKVVTGN